MFWAVGVDALPVVRRYPALTTNCALFELTMW
jgi:hypothetical protein